MSNQEEQPDSRFDSHYENIQSLKTAATTAISRVLGVRENEKLLIVTNPRPDVSDISMALYDAAVEAGAQPVLVYQQMKSQLDFAEPSVIEALGARPAVFISMSAGKLGKDRKAISEPYLSGDKRYDSLFHYLLYGEKSVRSFWSPGITQDIFIRTVPIDYDVLKTRCAALKAILDPATAVHIKTKAGTDLRIGLQARIAFVDDGNFTSRGRGGNLPAGETFISPQLGSSNGTIVFDGSIASHRGTIKIRNPIRVTVRDGFVTDVEGGQEAEELADTIRRGEENASAFEEQGTLAQGLGAIYRRNARNIGELGIGLNPAARVTGNMLEDEKAFRTCHIAIGQNYDEDAPALIHLDGTILNPTIVATGVDGRPVPIMTDGEFDCFPAI
jgi:leucyl aminopeptidase (aminopeptidase T)